MKKGLSKTKARPGRLKLDDDNRGPCWDWIVAWNIMSNTKSACWNRRRNAPLLERVTAAAEECQLSQSTLIAYRRTRLKLLWAANRHHR